MEDLNAHNQGMPMVPNRRQFEMDSGVAGVELRRGIDNYSREETNSFGAKWSINSKLINDHLAISILCKPNHEYADGWFIRANARIMVEEGNEESMEHTISLTFNDENRELGIPNFVSWATVEERFLGLGHIFVRVWMDIEEMIGTERRGRVNFSDPETPGRDAVLVVGGQKFYVVKERLADLSPFFQVLFYGDFFEANQDEIELKEFTATAFQVFLEFNFTAEFDFLFSHPSDDFVNDLLATCDMFSVVHVCELCGLFLARNSKKSLKEKLRLFHRYGIETLKKHCLKEFADCQSFVESIESIRHKTPPYDPDCPFSMIFVSSEQRAFKISKRLRDPEVVEMMEAINGPGNNQ